MKKILMTLFLALALIGLVSAAKEPTCTTIQSGLLVNSVGDTIMTGYDDWGYNYQARIFNGGYCDAYRDAAWCQPYADVDVIMKWNDAWLSNVDCDKDGLLDRHYGFPSYIGSGAWETNHQFGSYPGENYNWDVTGDWVITVNNGAYPHDYTFNMVSLEDGTFVGIGGYPAGSTYSIDEIVVDGTIVDDTISFIANYYDPTTHLPTGYSWTATGTIAADGTMSGTGTSGVFEWHSTVGVATQIFETCYWSDFYKIVALPTVDTPCDNPIWGEFCIIQEVYNDPCAGYEGLLFKDMEIGPGFGAW